MEIFKDFHNGIINKAVNVTYIALIAKKEKCSLAFDYKPISFTTALYKIIAKVNCRKTQNNPSRYHFRKSNGLY